MTGEERALHGMVYQLEAAWNAADSASFAALFADDADFIHILGGYYTGRAAIEAGHRMIFGTIYKGSTVRYSVEKIRFLRPDIALVSSPVFAVSRRRCCERAGDTAHPHCRKSRWELANCGAAKHQDHGSGHGAEVSSLSS
jgi:uncharacterized protein (TIGR02246 family)